MTTHPAPAAQHAHRPTTAESLAWVAVVGWTAAWAAMQWSPSGLSWHFFNDGSHLLFSGPHLRLYAGHPELQIGPLAFVVAAPFVAGGTHAGLRAAQVLMTAVGPLLLAWIAPLVPSSRRPLRVLLAGLALAPGWTMLSVRWAHLDDVLALALAVAALRAVVAGRGVLAGLSLAAAMAAKPWALGFLPLLLVLDARRLRSLAAAALGTALAWGPFVLASSKTLAALHPPVAVARGSGLRTLGFGGDTVPAWDRTLQLVAEPAAAAAAWARDRWPGILLAAVAVRLAVDPQDNAYYAGGAVLAAVVFDLLGTRWTVPWTSVVTAVVWWQPFVRDYARRFATTHGPVLWWYRHPDAIGWVHVLWALAALVLVLAVRSRPSAVEEGAARPGAGRLGTA